MPPTPEPSRLPTDSKPEPEHPTPTDAPDRSPKPAVLALGGILLLLLAFALLMIRSRMRGGAGADAAHADPSVGAPQGLTGATRLGGGSLGTLNPLDGSDAIPLNRDLLVSEEGLVIGRAAELCHVEIRDPRISRRHVRCRLVRGQIWIEALHSAAGTHVDGIRAEPFRAIRISPGQVLRIGTRSYRLSPLAHNSSI